MADGTLKVGTITTSSGSGTITLGQSGETITVPSGATTTLTDGISGDLKFNSGFGSVTTAYGVRAWVKFDAIGTLTVNGSGNVSSVTDTSAGTYEVNFTNNMPDTNYAVIGSPPGDLISTGNQKFPIYFSENYATSTFRLSVRQIDNDAPTMSSEDGDPCFAAVLR
jgi:hypothetical protein